MRLKSITGEAIPEGYVGWYEDYPKTSELTGESLWAGWCKALNEHHITLTINAYFEVQFKVHCPDHGSCTYSVITEKADCWVMTWVDALGAEAFDERYKMVDQGKDKPRKYVEEKPIRVGRWVMGSESEDEYPNFTLGIEIMEAGSG